MDRAVGQLKERLDHGQKKVNDLLNKIQDLSNRLKQHNADLGTRVRNAIENLKGSAKQHLKDLLAIWFLHHDDEEPQMVRERRSIHDVVEIHLKEKEVAERLCNVFLKMIPEVKKADAEVYCKEHVEKFAMLINKWLAAKSNSRNKRSVNEISDAVKAFFNDLKLKYHEKYADLAEWLKESYKNALEKATDRHDKMSRVSKEAILKMKQMKKQTVEELMNALRPYKEELGGLWEELVKAAKDTFKNKSE